MGGVKKEPLTLNTIPEDVFGKLLEKTDFKSIFALRRVSRNLRHYIDTKQPDIKLDHLCLKHNSGTDDVRVNGQKLIRKHSDSEDLLKSFGRILNFQKSELKSLLISFRDSNDAEEFFEKIFEIFSHKSIIKVSSVYLTVLNKTHLLQFLPFFDSEILERLSIDADNRQFENIDLREVVQTEQWKKAKDISVKFFCVDIGLEHFEHLEHVAITRDRLLVKEVKALKESFLSSPKPERHFYMAFNSCPEKQEILNYLGPSDQTFFMEANLKWEFEIEDKFLFIKLIRPDAASNEFNFVPRRIEFRIIDNERIEHYLER